MITVLLAVLAVVSSSSAFPFIHPQHITPEIEEVLQIYSELPLSVVPESAKKTEVQSSDEVYTPFEKVIQPEKTETQVSVSEVDSDQPNYNQKNTVVSKVQSPAVNIEHLQHTYTETSVLSPFKPLPVVSQDNRVWRPVIVPAEAIAEGRVIIAAAQPNQQRSFSVNPETYVFYQEPVQVKSHQQSEYVQSVEKHTPVQQEVRPTVQGDISDQVEPKDKPVVSQRTISVTQKVQKTVEPVENQNQVPVEPNSQVYSIVPNVQSVSTQNAAEQVETYTSGYTSVEIQSNVQEQGPVEKQVFRHTNQESVVQNQNYEVQTSVTENVKQQVPYQHTVENVEPSYNEQQVSEISQQEVSKCSQVLYQPVEQIKNAESVVATKTENQAQYQKDQVPVQEVEPQTHLVQAEKQAPHQQPAQVQTVELVHEQFQSVQPVSGNVEVNHQQLQTVEQTSKSSEVEQNVYVQHPETLNYEEETFHHFGDKISQIPIHSEPVIQSQVPSVGNTHK